MAMLQYSVITLVIFDRPINKQTKPVWYIYSLNNLSS